MGCHRLGGFSGRVPKLRFFDGGATGVFYFAALAVQVSASAYGHSMVGCRAMRANQVVVHEMHCGACCRLQPPPAVRGQARKQNAGNVDAIARRFDNGRLTLTVNSDSHGMSVAAVTLLTDPGGPL